MIKNQILIFDDLVPENLQNEIEDVLLGPDFPWYMSCHKDEKGNFLTSDYSQAKKFKDKKNIQDVGQLVHTFMRINENGLTVRSPYFDLILSVLELASKKYDLKNVLVKRIKSNMKPSSTFFNEDTYGIPHKDYDHPHYVLIYYVNDSDGDTVIFDNEKDLNIIKNVTPKKGRVLLFDGKFYHAAGNPISNNYRVIVNYDFTLDE